MGRTDIDQVLAAKTPQDLFNGLDYLQAKKRYRYLVRRVHPDMLSDESLKDDAERATKHLLDLWNIFVGNGDSVHASIKVVKTHKHEVVKTHKHEVVKTHKHEVVKTHKHEVVKTHKHKYEIFLETGSGEILDMFL